MRPMLASFIAVLALGIATPPSALAVDNIWKQWATEVTERGKIETPFAIIITLPAMLATTPLWAGAWAIGKMKGD
jgi:hypothetical protein